MTAVTVTQPGADATAVSSIPSIARKPIARKPLPQGGTARPLNVLTVVETEVSSSSTSPNTNYAGNQTSIPAQVSQPVQSQPQLPQQGAPQPRQQQYPQYQQQYLQQPLHQALQQPLATASQAGYYTYGYSSPVMTTSPVQYTRHGITYSTNTAIAPTNTAAAPTKTNSQSALQQRKRAQSIPYQPLQQISQQQQVSGSFYAQRRFSAASGVQSVSTQSSTPNINPRASVVYGSLVSIAGSTPASTVAPITQQATMHPQQTHRDMSSQIKSQSPVPGQIAHMNSFDSTNTTSSIPGNWTPSSSAVQSPTASSMSSFSSNPGHSAPQLSPRPPQSMTRSMSANSSISSSSLPTCNHCKNAVAPNVSMFECLICSTAGVSTRFCIFCYTTGAAASGHSQHNQTYYVTGSDPAIQPKENIDKTDSTTYVPPQLWATRKNAAGRIWYEHRATGFRTYVRPMTTIINSTGLSAGWMTRFNPDGRKYYYNTCTGTTSWTRPTVAALPSGWKEFRTPDGVSFYVCEKLQLACWERPGEQPQAAAGKQPAPTANAAAGVPGTKPDGKSGGVAQSGKTSTKKPSKIGGVAQSGKTSSKKPSKTGITAGVAAASTAVDVAVNIAKLSNATDLTPQGILSATVAAAKLTSHGVKYAGKKMKIGKFAKKTGLRRASRLLIQASRLAGDNGGDNDNDDDDDYEDDDLNDDDEIDYQDEDPSVNESVGDDIAEYDEAAGGGDVQQQITADEQSNSTSSPDNVYYDNQYSYEQQSTSESPQDPIYQQSAFDNTYSSAQGVVPTDWQPQGSPTGQDSSSNQSTEQGPIVINNISVTENIVSNESVVENTNTQITDNDFTQNNQSIYSLENISESTETNYVTVNESNSEAVNNFQAYSTYPSTALVNPNEDIPGEFGAPYGSGLPPLN